MKRLMAAGGTAIYQLTRAFRGGESGPLHNPEFSILEWYMRGESMQDGIRRLSRLCDAILGVGACETLAYADAMRTFAGVDALDSPVAVLVDAARRHRIAAPCGLSDDDRDGWLDLLMAMCVEPHLGQDRPAIVVYYPASQAALARICPDNPLVAERFELFVRGVELANGYHELADADELRRRFEHANMLRTADGKPALPHPEQLLAAIETGLPDCTGVALGLDRLVMLAVGAQALDEVIAMPIDRA
jgi:lysyl-tRNA synthetase class 2